VPAKFSRKWRLSATVAAGLLRMSSLRSFLFEELLGGLVGFGASSASLPEGKGLSLAGESGVALDRGEADAEEAGGVELGHAALVDGLDYLLA
jgi:hypothetical protein